MSNFKGCFPVSEKTITSNEFLHLSTSAKYLYCILSLFHYRFRNEYGWFFRNIESLATDCGMSIGTIKRAKKELLNEGFIEIRRKYYRNSGIRSSDEYRIVMD